MSKEASAKVQRGHTPEGKPKTTAQKQETIKIPFRHECDSSERGR